MAGAERDESGVSSRAAEEFLSFSPTKLFTTIFVYIFHPEVIPYTIEEGDWSSTVPPVKFAITTQIFISIFNWFFDKQDDIPIKMDLHDPNIVRAIIFFLIPFMIISYSLIARASERPARNFLDGMALLFYLYCYLYGMFNIMGLFISPFVLYSKTTYPLHGLAEFFGNAIGWIVLAPTLLGTSKTFRHAFDVTGIDVIWISLLSAALSFGILIGSDDLFPNIGPKNKNTQPPAAAQEVNSKAELGGPEIDLENRPSDSLPKKSGYLQTSFTTRFAPPLAGAGGPAPRYNFLDRWLSEDGCWMWGGQKYETSMNIGIDACIRVTNDIRCENNLRYMFGMWGRYVLFYNNNGVFWSRDNRVFHSAGLDAKCPTRQ